MKTKAKTSKVPNLQAHLFSALRRASKKWPPIYEVANKQKRYVEVLKVDETHYKVVCRSPRTTFEIESTRAIRLGSRVMWECEQCGRWFFRDGYSHKLVTSGRGKKKKTVRKTIYNKDMFALDHIVPVINPVTGFVTWDDYIDKLFNGSIQYLCNYAGELDGVRSCHKIKSVQEDEVRKQRLKKEKAAPRTALTR